MVKIKVRFKDGQGLGGGIGKGPDGNCICPKCDYIIKHTTGSPCNKIKCPKCGNTMIRKES